MMGKRKVEDNDLEAGLRRCSKCGEWKPLIDFARNKARYSGYECRCLLCKKVYAAQYYAKHREELRVRRACYRTEHREDGRMRSAQYYAKHREKILIKQVQYRSENREKIGVRHARYQAEHREKMRAANSRCYAKHRGERRAYRIQYEANHLEERRIRDARRRTLRRKNPAEPVFVMVDYFKKLYKNGKGKCYYCRKTFNWILRYDPPRRGKHYHEEHIIPNSKGGGYTRDNMVLACWRCNLKKHDKTPIQAGMALL